MKAPLKYRLQNFWFVLSHSDFWVPKIECYNCYEYDQLINKWMDEGFLKLESGLIFSRVYTLTTDNKDLIWVENYPYSSGCEYTRGSNCINRKCVYPITKYRLELYKQKLIHERNTRTN